MITPGRRHPLALSLTGGNRNDVTQLMPLLRGIAPVRSGLGVHRWVIEQTLSLLHWFRRLRIRWEIQDDIHEAFMTLAAAIICWRRLVR